MSTQTTPKAPTKAKKFGDPKDDKEGDFFYQLSVSTMLVQKVLFNRVNEVSDLKEKEALLRCLISVSKTVKRVIG